MYTEDDAAGRWCPWVRARVITCTHQDYGPFNRTVAMTGDATADARCIGSRCIAWRWLPNEPVVRDEPATYQPQPGEELLGKQARWNPHLGHPEEYVMVATVPPRTGYCGIAGRPE